MKLRRSALPLVGLVAIGLLASACGPSSPPTPPPPPPAAQDPASLGEGNTPINYEAFGMTTSSDGRFVLFGSAATNVVSDGVPDSLGAAKLYLRDRQTGNVKRVAQGAAQGRINAAGTFAAYSAQACSPLCPLPVSVYNRVTDTTESFTPSGDAQGTPYVSDDGRYVVWGQSGLSLLGDPTGGCGVRDMDTDTDTLCPNPAGVDSAVGERGLLLASRNTRFVLYRWANPNDPTDPNTGVKLWDRVSGTVLSIDHPDTYFGIFGMGAVSDDGTRVMGLKDNGVPSGIPVVIDLPGHSVLEMPVQPDAFANPGDMSSDGRYVAINTRAGNLSPIDDNGLSDVYVWDTTTGSITLVSKSLIDGSALSVESFTSYGQGGTFTDDGFVGVMTPEPLVGLDTNGVRDTYLLPFFD